MSDNSRSKLLFGTGALVLAAAAAGIVVLSALTTWWALFALLALCPLTMLACGAAIASPMSGRFGGFCGGGWCAGRLPGNVGHGARVL